MRDQWRSGFIADNSNMGFADDTEWDSRVPGIRDKNCSVARGDTTGTQRSSLRHFAPHVTICVIQEIFQLLFDKKCLFAS